MDKRPATFREELTGHDHHQGKVNNEHEETWNQALVVWRLDNAIHPTNCYPAGKTYKKSV